MVTDAGETVLTAGQPAGFPAGRADGHHLQNRSAQEAVVLEVGSRHPSVDAVDYADLDMILRAGEQGRYRHRDGKPYAEDAGDS